MREWLKRFVIPSFPLGALLALGLFGVGFVFAFPDDSYQWLWELVIAVAIILWVLGAGFFASLGWPSNIQEIPQSYKKTTALSDDKQDSKLSPSFSALVDAINAHSRANIAEESKEDNERSLRERITIILLAITMIAIVFQVIEMKKVYEPIARQARIAQDNIVADHRAWIGVTRGSIDMAQDKPVHATVMYNNTGRQPAPLSININILPYTYDDWAISGKAIKDINAAQDTCFRVKDKITPTLTVFPGTGPSQYRYDFTGNDVLVDKGLLSGDKVIVVFGCFLYKTYGQIRHTSYCGFDLSGTNVVQNLSFCNVGNDAD